MNSMYHKYFLFVLGFVEKYENRPVYLETMTLWEVAKSINTKTWKRHVKHHIVGIYPKYCLGDDDDLNEKYYRQIVLLHVPWRSLDMFSGVTSWYQFYLESNINCPIICLLDNGES